MSVKGKLMNSRHNSNKKESHYCLEHCSCGSSRNSDDNHINSLCLVFYELSAVLSDFHVLTHVILEFNELL